MEVRRTLAFFRWYANSGSNSVSPVRCTQLESFDMLFRAVRMALGTCDNGHWRTDNGHVANEIDLTTQSVAEKIAEAQFYQPAIAANQSQINWSRHPSVKKAFVAQQAALSPRPKVKPSSIRFALFR